MNAAPTWPVFYGSLADQLLLFSTEKHKLFDIIQSLSAKTPLMDYLKLDNPEFWEARDYEIDPFSVMSVFNRATTASHRYELAMKIAGAIGMKKPTPPTVFHGIPYLDPRHSIFSGSETMWELAFVARSDKPHSKDFIIAWDKAINIKGNGLGMLTIGLFWINADAYMALDKVSDPWIESKYGVEAPKDKCDGELYVKFLEELREKTGEESWAAITLSAWSDAKGKKKLIGS